MTKWDTQNNQLTRVFEFNTYMEGIQFVHQVAEFAEIQNHHPLMEVDYQKVTVNLTTHEEGTVTNKDKQLAILIDNAYEKGVR
ncbi:MAG: 4a-hydroxytetrahydrobiopterin dehydratase [Paenisporosarcina sp.]